MSWTCRCTAEYENAILQQKLKLVSVYLIDKERMINVFISTVLAWYFNISNVRF